MKLSIHRWFAGVFALLATLVLSALALAQGGPATLTGVQYLERGEQAELELTLVGQATVTVEAIPEGSGFQVTLYATDVASDLKLPELAADA
ncbi:MAG TPA: hypothetical protein VEI97_02960, partial [bacterium]|nr:hypothetical protein [bacterium]